MADPDWRTDVPHRRTLRDRLLPRLVITEAPERPDYLDRPLIGPCLIWTGAKDRHGYGLISIGGRSTGNVGTHRAAFAVLTGKWPTDGLDHLCRVPACASPAHLEPATQRENIRRGIWGKRTAALKAMTHCKRNHEFTPENTYITSIGSRQCRICVRDRRRQAYDPDKERARKQRRKVGESP